MSDPLTPEERAVVDRMRTRLTHLVWSESVEDDLATLDIIDRLCSRPTAHDDAEVEAIRERDYDTRTEAGRDRHWLLRAYDAMRAERDEARRGSSPWWRDLCADIGEELAALRRLRAAVEEDDKLACGIALKYVNNQYGCDTADRAIDEYRARLLDEMKGGTP